MSISKLTYGEKLRHPKWQKLRLEILKRDKWKCVLCGDVDTTLNVHHLKYSGDPWEAKKEDLESLCEDCHRIKHGHYFHEQHRKTDVVYYVVKLPAEYGSKPAFAFTNNGIRCLFIDNSGVHLQYTMPVDALETLYKKRPKNSKPKNAA